MELDGSSTTWGDNTSRILMSSYSYGSWFLIEISKWETHLGHEMSH